MAHTHPKNTQVPPPGKMAAMYMSIRKGYWDCQSSLYPTPNGPFFVLVMIKLVIKLREVQFGL